MFYYLHLTRPPPEQANPTLPLLITPNIANDLRTEYPSPGPGGIDIFYAWVKNVEPTQGPSCATGTSTTTSKTHALGSMTTPQKLTTWTVGNSYKEVHAFPPKDALRGGRWQLLLCTRPSESGPGLRTYAASVDLSAESFGRDVFLPILSAPVLFNTRAINGAERKQMRNERVFKLPLSLWGTPSIGPLRVTEHLSYDIDKKVWDSGVGLSHWLVSTMTGKTEAPPVIQSLMGGRKSTILELGAGTGLVSLILSSLLNYCPGCSGANVITTDLASAMEILETNITNNEHCYPSIRPKAVVLDWDDETLPPEVTCDGLDFIIMADVTYNTASFPSLARTLSQLSLLRPAHAPPPAVLLAYKERDPDERRLWDMARDIGLRFEEIARVPGASGMPVEIYVGVFEGRDE